MPKKVNQRGKKAERTKQVPVVLEQEGGGVENGHTAEAEFHYQLHIPAAKAPNEVHKIHEQIQQVEEPALHSELHFVKAHNSAKDHKQYKHSKKIFVKIWNTLEWFATSALIFVVLFFAINFSSYAELFKSRFDKLRGDVTTNPYIDKLFEAAEKPQTQELLPITVTSGQSKKQIPPIALEIAPPDDRIIIPRINKNVPVVSVSSENILLRDWNALEKDIQNALQSGVVHYPGTAEPGQKGNVVITGHSSYFPWDPGRFKDVFALLHQVSIGDKVIVYHNQKAYTYEVYETKVIPPEKVDVLTQEGGDHLTLITCTPVGTNLKRLIVLAKPII